MLRILCILFDHKADTEWGVKIVYDDMKRNRFGIRACERCGDCYFAFHRVEQRQVERVEPAVKPSVDVIAAVAAFEQGTKFLDLEGREVTSMMPSSDKADEVLIQVHYDEAEWFGVKPKTELKIYDGTENL